MARAMVTAGNDALKAAETKSAEGILAAGETINTSCDTCHERYWRQ
jgi:cytochrome c556